MNVIYSVKDYVTNVFDAHGGAASGAIDVVAVQHEDGSFRCTPFHVHFGKSKVRPSAAGTHWLIILVRKLKLASLCSSSA